MTGVCLFVCARARVCVEGDDPAEPELNQVHVHDPRVLLLLYTDNSNLWNLYSVCSLCLLEISAMCVRVRMCVSADGPVDGCKWVCMCPQTCAHEHVSLAPCDVGAHMLACTYLSRVKMPLCPVPPPVQASFFL